MSLQSTLAILLLGFSVTAGAHEGAGIVGGFSSGFMHPLLGWDHVAAMVAVGLWGAILGYPAIWLLPVVFPLVMAVGGALGVIGITFGLLTRWPSGKALVRAGGVVIALAGAVFLVRAV